MLKEPGRISLDIFGMINFGEIEITTKIIRSGRTIELIESILAAQQRTFLVARSWRMIISDTSQIQGVEDNKISHPDTLPAWRGMTHWGGGFIKSLTTRSSTNRRAGKGVVWVHSPVDMIYRIETSDFVKLMGLIDTANVIVPRVQQDISNGYIEWLFPNIDLQIHMHRLPTGQWLGLETVQQLGLETVQQIGTDGIGVTSSVLHDIQGVWATLQ